MKQISRFLRLSFLAVVMVMSCNSGKWPEVLIVVGNPTLLGKENKPVNENQQLRAGDIVAVGGSSKVKMRFKSSFIYVNESSTFSIGKTQNRDEVFLNLSRGNMHVLSRNGDVVTLNAIDVRLAVKNADVSILNDGNRLTVEVLAGEALVKQAGQEMRVGSCRKTVFEKGKVPQEMRLEQESVAHLREWVGRTVISTAVRMNGCFLGREENNTGVVVDTEQSVTEPEEPSVKESEKRVEEEFKAVPRNVVVEKANASDSVSSKKPLPELKVQLSMAMQAIPGENVPVRVSVQDDRSSAFLFRYDFDADGKYDLPGGDEFCDRDSVVHTFNKEGIHLTRVEVKCSDGRITLAERSILINKAPTAKLKAVPAKITVKTICKLDASDSKDVRDSVLLFRWDLDGDGRWDESDSAFSVRSTKEKVWEKAGTYKVGVLVKDQEGACDSVWAQVEVIEGFSAGPLAGPQKAFAGQEISFSCPISGEETITGYKWRFKCDNVLMEKSTAKPQVNMSFRMPGLYEVVCDVQGKNKLLSSQQTSIRIENSSLVVSAGGPYKGMVNNTVAFKGKAQSAHGSITQYEWDFDADGKPDFSSASPEAKYEFKRAGKHTVVLTARVADGQIGRDSVKVEIGHLPPKANAGEDIVSRPGNKVKLVGTGTDADGQVVRYEWDFDRDGSYDYKSETSGTVEHAFDVYSYVVLRVTDADGGTATDTVKVVICPSEMQTVEKGRFCIDRYEWPNKKGSVPDVEVTWAEAKSACEKAGKRLCTSAEWSQACRDGQEKQAFPYGKKFDSGKCNTLGNPSSTNKLSASGSFPDCAGSLSIFDMSGNAAEWTSSSDKENALVYGGFYQSGEKEGGCDSRLQLRKDKKYFYTGFRCCK